MGRRATERLAEVQRRPKSRACASRCGEAACDRFGDSAVRRPNCAARIRSSRGRLLLLESCLFIGSSVFFLAARRWARPLLEGRLGRFIHITPERLAGAEAWFERRGVWAIVLARWIPGGRVPTTLTAALLGLDYPTFARAVLGSGLLWLAVCMALGIMLGPTLDDLLTTHRALTAGVSAAIGFGIAAIVGTLLIRKRPS